MKWNLTNLSRSDLPDAVGLCIFQPQKKMTHEMMAINILITSFSTRFEMEVRVRWRKGRKIKFFMGSKKRILVLQLFFLEEKLTSSKRGMLDSLRLLLDPLLESDIEY